MLLGLSQDIRSRLNWATDYLKARSVPNPEVDAELILSYVLDHRQDESRFEHLIRLRATRYPLQYIIGSVNFMGLELKIKSGIFVPRPETELLVETTLNTIGERRMTLLRQGFRGQANDEPYILDLCTGCGNIAISLTKYSKIAKIIASDISENAIAVAQQNIELHGCENIKLIKSNLFEDIDRKGFDIIVSNPPYISERDFDGLMPEVLYEPRSSLYGGKGGLQFYERIFAEAPRFLKKDGYIIVEIGYNQKNAIRDLLDSGKLCLEKTVQDYNGIDRVVVIKRSPNLRNEMT